MGKWRRYWQKKGHQTKNRVEHFRSLDCSQLYDNRTYSLQEGEDAWFHGWHLNLFNSHTLATLSHERQETRYPIPVVTTHCNYGGQRHWFLCPFPSCQRRSKKLYFCNQGLFLCRKCLHLAYTTQNRSEADRIIDKKWHLIRKYGGDSEWTMKKPKGMHQKTFDQIRNEVCRLDEMATLKIAEMFGYPGM